MQSLAGTMTRFHLRLARFPVAVTLASFVILFLFFCAAARNFLTPVAISNILSFTSIIRPPSG